MKKLLLAFAALTGLAGQSFGQAPPPVPALPDASRISTYSVSAGLCACSVGFQIYLDGVDVDNALQVFIGSTQVLSTDPTRGWVITSPTGSLANIPRPIVDAVLTFNAVQTGQVTILGAQRPRRLSEFSENAGIPARNFNQVLNTLFAEGREHWDQLGRTIKGQPGEVLNLLPPAATRQGGVLAFDAGGQPIIGSSGGQPTRTVLTAPLTYFVDNVAGNDNNNGLTAGTAFATIAKAFSVVQNTLDTRGQTVTIQLATGQSWSNNVFSGTLTGGGTLTLDGGAGTITGTGGLPALKIEQVANASLGNTFFNIQNVTLTCTGGGAAIQVGGGTVTTGAGVTFGACPAGQHIFIDSTAGRWLPLNNYTISGGAADHCLGLAGGLCDTNNAGLTVTLTGTPAFSVCFVNATDGGGVIAYATYSGAATGTRYCASNNGWIDTNSGGANKLPGNAAGFVNTGGVYDSPGTPSIQAASCGTSPGAIFGTDKSGLLAEGTTATGCIINFTTKNTPLACSVNSNNATVQAGLTISSVTSTQLAVVHPSASGAILFWNCPAN